MHWWRLWASAVFCRPTAQSAGLAWAQGMWHTGVTVVSVPRSLSVSSLSLPSFLSFLLLSIDRLSSLLVCTPVYLAYHLAISVH